MMTRLIISLMLTLGISSVAMALSGHHGNHLDWDQLNLTETQQKRIQTLRKDYREQFQSLRKQDTDKVEKKQKMLVLRNKMIAETQQVLTPEQRQEASSMMLEKMEKRISKRLSRLASKLALTSEQQASIQVLLSAKLAEIKDPLLAGSIPTFYDRQRMFDQLDKAMPSILSSDQLAQWQQIKQKRGKHMASC
jgi:Spy/CpxP family protein refolding chaperone